MIHIINAYIAGCNKEQLEALSKHIIERQTVLIQSRELRLKLFRERNNQV
tara:strand:- start:12 stop:161 length:150 start_codon:yes stop_codon:yes gene_type:complete